MKEIQLSQGKVALVSDEDYEYLSQWNWHAQKSHRNYYAVRGEYHRDEQGKWIRKQIAMHRVVAELAGYVLTDTVDHCDNNGLNNQRCNLRSATYQQNQQNRRLSKNSTSGHTGVTWHKIRKKWRAHIKHNYKEIHLGYHDKKEDAIKARKEAEQKYFTIGN